MISVFASSGRLSGPSVKPQKLNKRQKFIKNLAKQPMVYSQFDIGPSPSGGTEVRVVNIIDPK